MSRSKSIYTKSLSRSIAKQAKSTTGKFHVIRGDIDRWNIVVHGRIRPYKTFSTKRAAVIFAKRHAKSVLPAEVVIHGNDGKVLERISY